MLAYEISRDRATCVSGCLLLSMKNHEYVGRRINYRPVKITEDNAIDNAEIKMFEPRGEIFNQPMVAIDEIPHWIPFSDCIPLWPS